MALTKFLADPLEKNDISDNGETKSGGKPQFDLVRTYLREIGRIPLLTHEQEISYGKQVQQLMALLQVKEALGCQLHYTPTTREWAIHVRLSEAELTAIVQRGERAKQKMIEANLRLVVAIAKKYQKRGMEFLDLIQEGSFGLARGIEKFDPAKGYKLSTYCWWWIRQAITRVIAQQARTIRLPIHITEKLNKIKKVQRELAQKLGRSPTPAEIAQELELEPAQIREYLNLARQPVSLDIRVGDSQDTELQDLLEDEGPLPEHYMMQESLHQDLDHLLSKLTPQQRQVLGLRFGLEDGNELSLNQTGEQLKLSRERIRQIEKGAIERLRRAAQPQHSSAKPAIPDRGCDEAIAQANVPAPVELAIASQKLASPATSESLQQLTLFEWQDGVAIIPELAQPLVSAA